jgi:hypothetical protein
VEKVHAEVDWEAYYRDIRDVCPWSYAAFMQDKILVVPYSENCFPTWRLFLHYTAFEAVVFSFPDTVTSEYLETKCDALNEEDAKSEWLWSHPEQEGDSTPVPVLIQQERSKLEKLRQKVGYYDES